MASMEEIKLMHLQELEGIREPGWYRGLNGVPCVLYYGRLISIFVNDDGDFDVTVDVPDTDGVFTENILWVTRGVLNDALQVARQVISILNKKTDTSLADRSIRALERQGVRAMNLEE